MHSLSVIALQVMNRGLQFPIKADSNSLAMEIEWMGRVWFLCK
jgi:hypothetical protein